jgi:glycosyltransferase involved in cell wall biosynthesis
LIRATFAVPGDLATPTGGYVYARRLIGAGPAAGLDLHHLGLPEGFPSPDAAALTQAARLLRAAPADMPLLVDGLALGAMPAETLASVEAPIAALVHHPLALETGLSDANAARLLASEGAALAFARVVIAPSRATASLVADMFAVDPERIAVARPGLDRADAAPGGAAPPHILCVASLTPRKAHDVLVDALARIAELPWRATFLGARGRDREWEARIRARIAASGLADRITIVGGVDPDGLGRAYASADIFAMASRYEGYGMVYAEAMAHGLPVVAARHAASQEVCPPQAALLVPPDDASACAGALRRLLQDPALRRSMGAAAHAHAATLPGWEDTARIVAETLARIAP